MSVGLCFLKCDHFRLQRLYKKKNAKKSRKKRVSRHTETLSYCSHGKQGASATLGRLVLNYEKAAKPDIISLRVPNSGRLKTPKAYVLPVKNAKVAPSHTALAVAALGIVKNAPA